MSNLIDIGANLTDPMFEGVYNGTDKHQPDLDDVLERAWKSGLNRIVVTGGSKDESAKAIRLAHKDDRLFCTVGCHPTRCSEFDAHPGGPDGYAADLLRLAEEGGDKVVAFGELGLDYDRLHFCPKEVQLRHLRRQLELAEKCRLPLFLHCRDAADDLAQMLAEFEGRLHGGVVHSFDGTLGEAERFIDLGYAIGINGCSLKTEANLEVVKVLPSDRLMLETDCPWCEVRPTHAGAKWVKEAAPFPSVKKEKWKEGNMVKGRNEPCNIT